MHRLIFAFFAALVVFSAFAPQSTFAYAVSTHAYLTKETIDFYNRSFPQNAISSDLEEYLIRGAREEDADPRYLNHFYDPVYNRGLKYLGDWPTSKKWALNGLGNKFTWQEGLDAYARGDTPQAMLVLGHILHLLQDLSVPEHTRNDPHPFGAPYEDWGRQFSIEAPDKDLKTLLAGRTPVELNTVEDYFDKLATYTNQNFYSFHTIGVQSGYPNPVVDNFEAKNGGLYTMHPGPDDYYLYFIRSQNSALIQNARNVTLQDAEVLRGYWQRLTPTAIAYGAGVINLFLNEVQKIKEPQQFLGNIIETATPPTSSPSATPPAAEVPPAEPPLPAAPPAPALIFYGGAPPVAPTPVPVPDPPPPLPSPPPSTPPPSEEIQEPVPEEVLPEATTTTTNESASTTVPLAVSPATTSLRVGTNNLSWTVDPPRRAIVFTARVLGPYEDIPARLELKFAAVNDPLPFTANLGGTTVEPGEISTIIINNVDSGTYHWSARVGNRNGGLGAWEDEQSDTFDTTMPPALAKGAFGFPNGYCGFTMAEFTPAADFALNSVEFFAACVNGACYPPNAFWIFDAAGENLLAESDGTGTSFGYPAPGHILEFFTGQNQILLKAGETYRATPHSANGQCLVQNGSEFNLR